MCEPQLHVSSCAWMAYKLSGNLDLQKSSPIYLCESLRFFWYNHWLWESWQNYLVDALKIFARSNLTKVRPLFTLSHQNVRGQDWHPDWDPCGVRIEILAGSGLKSLRSQDWNPCGVRIEILAGSGLKSWPSQDVQPDHAMISILSPQWFQSWPAMISILSPQGFQSWPRNDFNPDCARISILTAQGFQSYGKPDGTPKSWSIYSIVSILTEPGCDHDRST